MIVMSQKYCTLCNGSGYVNPYPYRQRKKCNHTWSRGSFMERFNTTAEAIEKANIEHNKWKFALENEIKD